MAELTDLSEKFLEKSVDKFTGNSKETPQNIIRENYQELTEDILVCPKCRARNLGSSQECLKCGVVFARYRKWAFERAPGEVRLQRHPELAKIWERILADYEDEYMHWNFISAARQADCLAYASHKYARILSVAPDEEIALTMKRRIQGLSALPLEVPRRQIERMQFRGVNGLLIALAAALILLGMNLHGMRNLVGLGAAVMTAALGWRWWASRPG
jgi:ribosomal protein L40E